MSSKKIPSVHIGETVKIANYTEKSIFINCTIIVDSRLIGPSVNANIFINCEIIIEKISDLRIYKCFMFKTVFQESDTHIKFQANLFDRESLSSLNNLKEKVFETCYLLIGENIHGPFSKIVSYDKLSVLDIKFKETIFHPSSW